MTFNKSASGATKPVHCSQLPDFTQKVTLCTYNGRNTRKRRNCSSAEGVLYSLCCSYRPSETRSVFCEVSIQCCNSAYSGQCVCVAPRWTRCVTEEDLLLASTEMQVLLCRLSNILDPDQGIGILTFSLSLDSAGYN